MLTNNNVNVKNNDDENKQNNSRKHIPFKLEKERSVGLDSSDTNHRDKII